MSDIPLVPDSLSLSEHGLLVVRCLSHRAFMGIQFADVLRRESLEDILENLHLFMKIGNGFEDMTAEQKEEFKAGIANIEEILQR